MFQNTCSILLKIISSLHLHHTIEQSMMKTVQDLTILGVRLIAFYNLCFNLSPCPDHRVKNMKIWKAPQVWRCVKPIIDSLNFTPHVQEHSEDCAVLVVWYISYSQTVKIYSRRPTCAHVCKKNLINALCLPHRPRHCDMRFVTLGWSWLDPSFHRVILAKSCTLCGHQFPYL